MKANFTLNLFLFIGLFLNSLWLHADTGDIGIDQKKHALVAPKGSSYQWYRDDQLLMGENSPELIVASAGHYSVRVVNEHCESVTSHITVGITEAGAIIRIFTIGDSTVQDYAAGYYPRKGWGQVLPAFFNGSGVQVVNKAVGGTSSKSFYNNYWTAVRNALAPGDFVFIQFGINDRNKADASRYTPTGGEFESYLTKYVNETRAKGAYPVLVTTIRRNAWNADGKTVYDSYHDHPIAVRTIAQKLNVPLIDLDARAKILMEKLGKTYCTRFLYNNYLPGEYPNYPKGNTDDVHFQEMGAIEMAKIITDGIKALSADANVKKLIPYLKPMYEVTVLVNPAGADSVTTHTTTYPQGLTITLKTISKTRSTFLRWNNAGGASVGTGKMYTFTSGTANTTYTALYKGAATCTAAISASGPTAICQGDKLTLTASAGTGYVWRKDGITVGTAATYSPIASGSYTVEVTNASNCKAVSSPVTVTVAPAAAWYADADKDGKGDPNQVKWACTQPTGYVADHSDQCPADPLKATPGNCGCGRTEQSCVDCNNVANGSASIDACGICIGGNTGRAACTTAEAEAVVCAYDGVPETINAGFKGASYINGINVKGAKFSIAVNSVNAVNAMLAFRYACGSPTNRYAKVVVNGDTLAQLLSFPSTGNFTTWKTAALSAPLRAGNNSITLIANTNEGLVNIDEIQYLTPGTSKGTCAAATKLGDDSANNTLYYPNPYTEALMLPEGGDYTLYDLGGNVVERGSCKQSCEAGKGLPAGVYLLELHKDTWSVKTKVTKQ